MGAKSVRMAQRTRQEQEVQQPLLRGIRHDLEIGQVQQRAQHVHQIAGGKAEQVDAAEQEIVIRREFRHAVIVHCLMAIEQAVTVNAGPRRIVRRGIGRYLAGEARGHRAG